MRLEKKKKMKSISDFCNETATVYSGYAISCTQFRVCIARERGKRDAVAAAIREGEMNTFG